MGERDPILPKEEADKTWVRPQIPWREGTSLRQGKRPELKAGGHSMGAGWRGSPQQDGQGRHRTLGGLTAKGACERGVGTAGP